MSTPHAAAAAAEVRAVLARRQITQTTLAQLTGRSQAFWSRRLSGKIALNVDDLTAIATAARVPLADLLPTSYRSPLMSTLSDMITDDADADALAIPEPLTAGTPDGLDGLRGGQLWAFFVRHWVPAWLDLVPALAPHAAALRAVDTTDPAATLEVLSAASTAAVAAKAAAWEAGGDGSWQGAWDATERAAQAAPYASTWRSLWRQVHAIDAEASYGPAATGDAGATATCAAFLAAWQAAKPTQEAARVGVSRSAAAAAARPAAQDAAWTALKPTSDRLTADATALYRRLAALGGAA